MDDDASPHPDAELSPGDLCHHGTNALPLYRVIWIDEGRAWLRDVNTDVDAVVKLDRCRACTTEVEAEAPALSATEPTPGTWPDGSARP